MTTLVFLEHHEGELQKGALGVLAKAASLGGDVAGVVLGSGVDDVAATAGDYGAATVYVVDDPALEAPLPQPRVDALAAVVRETGAETVLFARLGARRRRRRRARGAARRRAQLGSHRPRARGRRARRQARRRSATRSSSTSAGRATPRSRSSAPARSSRPRPAGGAEVEDVAGVVQDFSTQARDGRAGARGGERAVDRGCRRDRRRRPRPRRARGLRARRGARGGARRRGRRDARGRRRRLVSVLGAGRPDRQVRVAEALRRARDLGRDPAQGRHAELRDDRRDQQGRERADLRLRRLRHRRRGRGRSYRSWPSSCARARPDDEREQIRAADFPPPFSSAEAIAAPTDAADERIEVGVLIVGGGPGGLACAIRLGQLLEDDPRAAPSASATSRSRWSRRASSRARICSRAPWSTPARCAGCSRAARPACGIPNYGEVPGGGASTC